MSNEAFALVEGPRFSIGGVLQDSFETLVRAAPWLLAIVLIMAIPLWGWLLYGGEPLLAKFAATARVEFSLRDFDPAMAGLVLLIGIITFEIHAAVSDAAFRHLLGEEGNLLSNLSRAALSAPSVLVAGLLFSITFGTALGAIGLAAGLLVKVLHWSFGFILGLGGFAGVVALMLRCWLLIPVIVVERSGPIACFRRSNELTEGNRWKIGLLLLIVTVPQGFVKLLLLFATPAAGAPLIAVLNILVSGAFIVFNAVVAVVVYAHLRAMKEGTGLSELAEVFE